MLFSYHLLYFCTALSLIIMLSSHYHHHKSKTFSQLTQCPFTGTLLLFILFFCQLRNFFRTCCSVTIYCISVQPFFLIIILSSNHLHKSKTLSQLTQCPFTGTLLLYLFIINFHIIYPYHYPFIFYIFQCVSFGVV